MRILLLGAGAREHALLRALTRDPASHEVVVAPGNGGMSPCLALDPCDPAAVVTAAREFAADLIVIGPEAPLVAGVADATRAAGFATFGPDRAAAALEGSKAFAKAVMRDAGVPTGEADIAATLPAVAALLDRVGAPYVVKADGLAAGKGVLVTADRAAALAHAERYLDAGPVLVEEYLDGSEVSLFFLSDGETVLPLTPAQDFKRANDGDTGPNTGGMGAYSPLPWLVDQATGHGGTFGTEAAFVTEVLEQVARPTIAHLAAAGTPFVGLLYAGLVLTARGIRVIEFNARFGDPETQVVLARLRTPLADLLYATATGALAGRAWPAFTPDAAVGVVLAAPGYPESPRLGDGLDALDAYGTGDGSGSGASAGTRDADAHVLHAGTARRGGRLVTAGGRVATVVATGPDVASARAAAYRTVAAATFPGAHARSDIAAQVAQVAQVAHGTEAPEVPA